eukprot:326010_1
MSFYILLLLLHRCNGLDPSRPNFVFVLTDDQDLLFDSMSYMPFTKRFFEQNGVTFSNSFISTPICCPSRTESITGRGFQNIRQNKVDCMDISATYNVFDNAQSMFQLFHEHQYTTSSFGKLTNNMPTFWCKDNPRLTGFDRIHCPCDYNDFYGNEYMNYYPNGTLTIDKNISLTPSLYQTSMIGNASIEYLSEIINNKSNTKPFFTWIGLHAPHYPADPAAWYSDLYPNEIAPRTPNFNVHVENHHAFVSTNPEIDDNAMEWIDQLWRDRLRSLLSVDDLVADVVGLLKANNILNNTYVLFSSDHGYHLGQWRVPCSKQQVYETDIRIPTYLSGPSIEGNAISNHMVSNVDFLPSFLDLAGIEYDANTYDGMSWVRGGIIDAYDSNKIMGNISNWRDTLLVQYGGGNTIDFSHCQTWWPSNNGSFPGYDQRPDGCNDEGQCWMVNTSQGNNWRAIRIMNVTLNAVYAEFVYDYNNLTELNDPKFIEYYDIEKDPHQLHNIYSTLQPNIKTQFHDLLMNYARCNGTACW